MLRSLVHTKDASDQVLAKEAAVHFGVTPYLQFLAEIFVAVRPWLTTKALFRIFSVKTIMEALASRPDLRQELTTKLTGYKRIAARKKNPLEQTKLIEDALGNEEEPGDITLEDVEKEIAPETWAVYIFGDQFWKAFSSEVLADIVAANGEKEKEFITFFIEKALQERRHEGRELKPILTHLDVADAMDPDDTLKWQQRIPPEKLSEANRVRRAQERKTPRVPFTTKQEIGIIGIDVIVNSFDLTDFVPMVSAAGKSMGFDGEENPFADLAEDDRPKA